MSSDWLVGTTAPPDLRLNDPDYARKLAEWKRMVARDEEIRLRQALDLELLNRGRG